MRILAVDYGEKNVGVAVSDPSGIIAQPVGVVGPNVEEICALVKRYGVVKIIVGLPLNMDGTVGKTAQDATRFADGIRSSCGVPVEMVDERLTTAEAERILLEADVSRKKRKKKIDKLSAAILLGFYLRNMENA
jgi:putative Holliday junction resolvase